MEPARFMSRRIAAAGLAVGVLLSGAAVAPAHAASTPSTTAAPAFLPAAPAPSVPGTTPASVLLPAAAKTVKTTRTTDNLNLRTGAGTNHRSLGVLKKGTTVVPTGRKSGVWWQVKAAGKTGWAHSGYLKTTTRTVVDPVAAGGKAIRAKAKALGLGTAADRLQCKLAGGGCVQTWTKSGKAGGKTPIYWSQASGAHPVTGQILKQWNANGGPGGKDGYPLQDVRQRDGKTTQVFQKSSLVAAKSGATRYAKDECWALGAEKTRYRHGHANRVSFTISEKYGTHKATFINCVRVGSVYKQEWKNTRATVGLKGFKKPGVASGHTSNRWSPQGMFSVSEAFGEGNPGTKLAYRKLNAKSRWSGTPGASYNKYYEAPTSGHRRWPDENLYRIMKAGDYRQSVVINYNRPPHQKIKQGAGFAIFLHTNAVPTYGCIAIELKDLVRYLKTARPGDQIIMGVRGDIFKA